MSAARSPLSPAEQQAICDVARDAAEMMSNVDDALAKLVDMSRRDEER